MWPALPAPAASGLLALLFQLEHSQWLAPEALEVRQFTQLTETVRHAHATVPHYRSAFDAAGYVPGAGLDAGAFRRLPLVTRVELQSGGRNLWSTQVPPAHGRARESRTSGSTGMPVVFLSNDLTQYYWNALTLRDHLWHRRDLSGRLAAIRLKVQEAEWGGWGAPVDIVARSGPSSTLLVSHDVDVQLDWLASRNPDYLLSFPSNIEALARRCLERGIRLPALREVRSVGEMLPPGLREIVRASWGVPLVDIYSSSETGYIALQCPETGNYHVQSESVYVEILRADGSACLPGETGRVVVTALHNFAMPLIRYDIGDYAEAGEACACGRGLPVIRRVLGRVRNMVRLPGGGTHWPLLGALTALPSEMVRQFQCVQTALDRVEVRLVAARPLNAAETADLIAELRRKLGHPFDIELTYCERIERGSGGKFEEFRSEIT